MRTQIYPHDNEFMKEENKNNRIDLQDRILNFAVETLKLLMKLPRIKETDVIRFQLSKSVTAIGANFEEAQSSGHREFLHKLRLALKESNETRYWFKILERLNLQNHASLKELKEESEQISRILGAIVAKLAHKHK